MTAESSPSVAESEVLYEVGLCVFAVATYQLLTLHLLFSFSQHPLKALRERISPLLKLMRSQQFVHLPLNHYVGYLPSSERRGKSAVNEVVPALKREQVNFELHSILSIDSPAMLILCAFRI